MIKMSIYSTNHTFTVMFRYFNPDVFNFVTVSRPNFKVMKDSA